MRVLSLLFFLSLFSCNRYSIDSLPDNRLHFGNSGGITGEIREYILLLDNGRILFDNRLTGEVEKIGKLSNPKLVEIRAEVDQIAFRTPSPRPANRNTEVTLYRAGTAKQMQWSDNQAPDPAAGRCFEELMAEVRKMRAD